MSLRRNTVQPYQDTDFSAKHFCRKDVDDYVTNMGDNDIFTVIQLKTLIGEYTLDVVVNATLNSLSVTVRNKCGRLAAVVGTGTAANPQFPIVTFESLLIEAIDIEYIDSINSPASIISELLALTKYTWSTNSTDTPLTTHTKLYDGALVINDKSSANSPLSKINTWGDYTKISYGKNNIRIESSNTTYSTNIIAAIRTSQPSVSYNDLYEIYVGMIPKLTDTNVSLYFPENCGIEESTLLAKLGDLVMKRTKVGSDGKTVPIITMAFVLGTTGNPGVGNPTDVSADKSTFYTALKFCKKAEYTIADVLKQLGSRVTVNVIKDLADAYGQTFADLNFRARAALFSTEDNNKLSTVTIDNALRVATPATINFGLEALVTELMSLAADGKTYYYSGITASTAGEMATGDYTPTPELLKRAAVVKKLKTPLDSATNSFGVTKIISTTYELLDDDFLAEFYFWKDETNDIGDVYPYTTDVVFSGDLLARITDLVAGKNGYKLFLKKLGSRQTQANDATKLTQAKLNFTAIKDRLSSLEDALDTSNGYWNKISFTAAAAGTNGAAGTPATVTYASPLYLALLLFVGDEKYEQYSSNLMKILKENDARVKEVMQNNANAMYAAINKLVLWGAGPIKSDLEAEDILDIVGKNNFAAFLATFSVTATGSPSSLESDKQGFWAPFYPIIRKMGMEQFGPVAPMTKGVSATLAKNWALAFTDVTYAGQLRAKGAEIRELLTYTKSVRRYVNGVLMTAVEVLAFDVLDAEFLKNYGTTAEHVILEADKVDIQLE